MRNKDKLYDTQQMMISIRDHLTQEDYDQKYAHSIEDPEDFWEEQAEKYVTWFEPWDQVSNSDFNQGKIEWYSGAKLNVSYNCIDRHLESNGDQIAIIWEGDEIDHDKKITYNQLHELVCKFANVLKSRNIKKGDRVAIYMPMIPEAAIAMLACARIGAVHSVVFGGFSAIALRDRILDSNCQLLITADEGPRGGKSTPLKALAETALEQCPNVHTTIVVKRTGNYIPMNDKRDIWYHEAMQHAEADCSPEPMDAEDPLFILYTSGSTGKPKGVLHTTGGYLVYASMTHDTVFNYSPGDIYWCTADVGWITGHSYIVYGPLSNCATTLMFEGTPMYPDPGRFWQIIDTHQVNIFYTAPTAIRALMAKGEEYVKQYRRSSLKILGTVGEPINPEAWEWYYYIVGDSRCPIVDTWWQTETGGIMIVPLPGMTHLKPGAASFPFFGVEPALLDSNNNEIQGAGAGSLVIKQSWPGQMRTIYGDHKRFLDTYLRANPGYYTTGDGARRDSDGYLWITGRTDDVINVSGHRLGTAELESILTSHVGVTEAAVIGVPHDIKGEGIYAFVALNAGVELSQETKLELSCLISEIISPIAKPDVIQFCSGLPKTRSGKIMRRILRKIATRDFDNLGDTSTLSNPDVVNTLVQQTKLLDI